MVIDPHFSLVLLHLNLWHLNLQLFFLLKRHKGFPNNLMLLRVILRVAPVSDYLCYQITFLGLMSFLLLPLLKWDKLCDCILSSISRCGKWHYWVLLLNRQLGQQAALRQLIRMIDRVDVLTVRHLQLLFLDGPWIMIPWRSGVKLLYVLDQRSTLDWWVELLRLQEVQRCLTATLTCDILDG